MQIKTWKIVSKNLLSSYQLHFPTTRIPVIQLHSEMQVKVQFSHLSFEILNLDWIYI